jgi:hypothetical protein
LEQQHQHHRHPHQANPLSHQKTLQA